MPAAYDIDDAMKYTAAHKRFILFYILPFGKIFHAPKDYLY